MSKWLACMRVVWSNLLVYKINFMLQAFAPLLVFLFIKTSLWTVIYQGHPWAIAGYSLQQMLTYHLWILVVTLISLGAASQDLSEDIRLGRITAYLLYPFSLFEFHAAGFLARQCVKLAVALLTLLGATALLGMQAPLGKIIQALTLAFLAGVFWFALNYLFGLLGFWLEETWTFTVMIQIIAQFFSGAIIPLELYPAWLVRLLALTPFPYLGFVPAKLMMGQDLNFFFALLVLLCWIIAALGLGQVVYQKGLRSYTAAGM